MSRKTKYPELKRELKEIAKDIRYWKSKRKLKNRNGHLLCDIHVTLVRRKSDFRHRHIAYCELNGTERYKIERPCWKSRHNLPNEERIERIKNEHRLSSHEEKVFKRNMEI
jgi:hypothetical protein